MRRTRSTNTSVTPGPGGTSLARETPPSSTTGARSTSGAVPGGSRYGFPKEADQSLQYNLSSLIRIPPPVRGRCCRNARRCLSTRAVRRLLGPARTGGRDRHCSARPRSCLPCQRVRALPARRSKPAGCAWSIRQAWEWRYSPSRGRRRPRSLAWLEERRPEAIGPPSGNRGAGTCLALLRAALPG